MMIRFYEQDREEAWAAPQTRALVTVIEARTDTFASARRPIHAPHGCCRSLTQVAPWLASGQSGRHGDATQRSGPLVMECRDRRFQGHLRGRKVARIRVNPLVRWILQHTGAGVARSEITEGFYGLEPFYRGGYADPCLSPREKRERQTKCRRAQPTITKTLKRLEALGLVELVCRNRYVKAVRLTQKGAELARELNHPCGVAGHDQLG